MLKLVSVVTVSGEKNVDLTDEVKHSNAALRMAGDPAGASLLAMASAPLLQLRPP